MEGDRVWIEPVRSSLEAVFDSFVPLHEMSDDFDEEIEDAVSEDADRRMREWFGE